MNNMKTLRFLLRAGLAAAMIATAAPALKASAQDDGVTASAVVAPNQLSKIGFVIPGLVKEVRVEEGDSVKAGDVLVVLNVLDLEYAVAAAEAGLRSAQVNAELQRYGRVKERRNGKIFWTQLPKEVIEIADQQMVQAQAAIDIARANLAETTLLAPFDGTVASISIAPGELAQPHQVVITLASLDQLQIETTDLSERDIVKVKNGASADVFVEALEETIEGKVIAISPIADNVGGDVVFKVTIELEYQPKGLLWGMTAEVNISE